MTVYPILELASFMNLSAIEDEVLGRCASDYEAPHTIAGDIARDLARRVSEDEVRTAFLSLAAMGLVQAYRFEMPSNRYVSISGAEASREQEPWFLITTQGRKVADEPS